MRPLYITDLDGTLLDADGNLSARSASIITDLSREGALISVATARTPATVVNILADAYTTADLVVMTGAGLWNRPGRRFDHLDLLPPDDVRMMIPRIGQAGIHPFCYTLAPDGAHIDVFHAARELTPAEARFVELRAHLELKTFHLAQTCPEALADRVILLFAMGPYDAIAAVADDLRSRSDCYISYYKDTYAPDLWLLEIFAPGVSKAAGIERLRRRLGADTVIAFGDNLNDIPMLRAADIAVAVDNALPEVKAVAHHVIGPNTDDAVALFIERHYRGIISESHR